MLTLMDLTNQLNDYLQISLFNDYGPNGLQIEGKTSIKKVATAVSCSLKIIEEAIRSEVDVLIVHHGLFWNKDSPLITGIKKQKIHLLLEHGISLIAYHLPLDAHRQIGNNWKAALDLGWEDLEPFYLSNGQWMGVRGRITKTSRNRLRQAVEAYYGQEAAVAWGGPSEIETISLISGGAYRQIEEAERLGIDCYITGNFDEPAWHLAHEGKVNFYACGHAATEKIGPRTLAKYLSHHLNVEAIFLDEFNPF